MQGNEKAYMQAGRVFLQGRLNRLADIVQLHNFDDLLERFVLQFPEQRQNLVKELRKIPFVWKDETGRLQVWLRKLEF